MCSWETPEGNAAVAGKRRCVEDIECLRACCQDRWDADRVPGDGGPPYSQVGHFGMVVYTLIASGLYSIVGFLLGLGINKVTVDLEQANKPDAREGL